MQGVTLPSSFANSRRGRLAEILGAALLVSAGALTLALVSWSARDPSLNHATSGHVRNLLGGPGAIVSDLLMQLVGFGAIAAIVPIATQGLRLMRRRRIGRVMLRVGLCVLGVFATAATASLLPATDRWPLPTGLGGVAGDAILTVPRADLCRLRRPDRDLRRRRRSRRNSRRDRRSGAGLRIRERICASRSSEDDAKIRPGADDDDDAGGEPGVALISLGALIHLGLALKAWMLRAAGKTQTSRRDDGPAAAARAIRASSRPSRIWTFTPPLRRRGPKISTSRPLNPPRPLRACAPQDACARPRRAAPLQYALSRRRP